MNEKKQNKCGIVILNYNSHDLTVNLARKIEKFESVDDICVVDNCSSDSFENDFTSCKIHYIKNTRNAGYNAGNNIGLRYLINEKDCDYVYIANPDVIFENDAIEQTRDVFISDKSIALISTKRFGAESSIIHQYFNFPTLKKSISSCFILTRLGKESTNNEIQNYQIDNAVNGIRYVDAVPGAFFGIRSSFLQENNFLYEGIFLYGEELFVGRQAFNLGYKAAIINFSVYIHDHHRTYFSNSKMFWRDRVSLRKYYKFFHLLSITQLIALDFAIVFGTLEYNVASFLWRIIKKRQKT